MKKYSWLAVLAIIIFIGIIYFFFDRHFLIINWKIVSRSDYNSIILRDSLSESAQQADISKQIQISETLVNLENSHQSKIDLANAYLEKASLEFKEEYIDKALALINEVLSQEPDNFEANLAAGYSYEALQDYKQSIEFYNKAIALNGNSDIAYAKRGHAYDLAGDIAAAEEDFVKAFELNNQNDTALMNLARIAQRKGQWENAFNYAQSAASLTKIAYVKASSHEIVGLYYLETGDYEKAAQSFTDSISAYPNFGNAYSNRAYAKILLADYHIVDEKLKNEISSDLTRAIGIYNKDSFSHVIYGLLMESAGDKKSALDYYKKAADLVDQDITVGLGEREEMKAKIQQAILELNNN